MNENYMNNTIIKSPEHNMTFTKYE